jgi:hypothetical protein
MRVYCGYSDWTPEPGSANKRDAGIADDKLDAVFQRLLDERRESKTAGAREAAYRPGSPSSATSLPGSTAIDGVDCDGVHVEPGRWRGDGS